MAMITQNLDDQTLSHAAVTALFYHPLMLFAQRPSLLQ